MAQALFFLPLGGETKLIFDREVVLEIFCRGALQPIQYERLRYPDKSGGEIDCLYGTSEAIDHLSMTRFGGRTMMERIFEVAARFDTVLAWTDHAEGSPGSCVAHENLLERAADGIRTIGLVVVRDASHLNWLIKGSTFEENGW